jgi:YesN/AraC family two-component response regulator
MNDTKIRILIVDDQAIVRKGIKALFAEVEGIIVIGEAGSGKFKSHIYSISSY